MPAEKERLPGSMWLRRAGCSAVASRRRITILAASPSVCGRRMANSSPPTRKDRSTLRKPALDQRAEVGQRLVAEGVALGVVDRLEVVEVDQHQRHRRAIALRGVDLAIELLLEGPMVAEPGQRIGQGIGQGGFVADRQVGARLGQRRHDQVVERDAHQRGGDQRADQVAHGGHGDHADQQPLEHDTGQRAGAQRQRQAQPETRPRLVGGRSSRLFRQGVVHALLQVPPDVR